MFSFSSPLHLVGYSECTLVGFHLRSIRGPLRGPRSPWVLSPSMVAHLNAGLRRQSQALAALSGNCKLCVCALVKQQRASVGMSGLPVRLEQKERQLMHSSSQKRVSPPPPTTTFTAVLLLHSVRRCWEIHQNTGDNTVEPLNSSLCP